MLLPREEMSYRNYHFLNCFYPRLHVLVYVVTGNLVKIVCGRYAWVFYLLLKLSITKQVMVLCARSINKHVDNNEGVNVSEPSLQSNCRPTNITYLIQCTRIVYGSEYSGLWLMFAKCLAKGASK